MTLSTSETRSRNWACPEVTSSPIKVLGRGRQHRHEMQPLRTPAICTAEEKPGRKPTDLGRGSHPVSLVHSLSCSMSQLSQSPDSLSVNLPFPVLTHTALLPLLDVVTLPGMPSPTTTKTQTQKLLHLHSPFSITVPIANDSCPQGGLFSRTLLPGICHASHKHSHMLSLVFKNSPLNPRLQPVPIPFSVKLLKKTICPPSLSLFHLPSSTHFAGSALVKVANNLHVTKSKGHFADCLVPAHQYLTQWTLPSLKPFSLLAPKTPPAMQSWFNPASCLPVQCLLPSSLLSSLPMVKITGSPPFAISRRLFSPSPASHTGQHFYLQLVPLLNTQLYM